MDFRAVWDLVSEAEGLEFAGARGEVFTYRFKKTYVVTDPGAQSIPRTNFEKVYRRMQSGEKQTPAVQGQARILAILEDLRIETGA